MGQGRSEDANSHSAEEDVHTLYGIGDFITFYTKKRPFGCTLFGVYFTMMHFNIIFLYTPWLSKVSVQFNMRLRITYFWP
jgi:hypothetical protein